MFIVVIVKKIVINGSESFIPSKKPFFSDFLPKIKLFVNSDISKNIIFKMLYVVGDIILKKYSVVVKARVKRIDNNVNKNVIKYDFIISHL